MKNIGHWIVGFVVGLVIGYVIIAPLIRGITCKSHLNSTSTTIPTKGGESHVPQTKAKAKEEAP